MLFIWIVDLWWKDLWRPGPSPPSHQDQLASQHRLRGRAPWQSGVNFFRHFCNLYAYFCCNDKLSCQASFCQHKVHTQIQVNIQIQIQDHMKIQVQIPDHMKLHIQTQDHMKIRIQSQLSAHIIRQAPASAKSLREKSHSLGISSSNPSILFAHLW